MKIIKERLSVKDFMPNWVWYDIKTRFNFAQKFVRNMTIVDCACGTGIGTEGFMKAGAKCIRAFDVSHEAIIEARRRISSKDVMFDIASAIELPVEDNFADVYISLETIEHVEDDGRYLAEAYRILKPGGKLICSTPNRSVINPGKDIDDKPLNKFHVREYAEEEFLDLLKNKFDKVEIYGHNPNSCWKVRIMNFLGKMLPFHGAVRLNQLLKIPKIFYDKIEYHAVTEMKKGYDYEYLVAICIK